MVHKSSFRWGRVLLPCLIALYVVSGCGIPSNPYLWPPKFKKLSQGGETTFEFLNDTRNSNLFLEGYELYYKFYSFDVSDTTYDSDKNQIEALTNEDLTLTTLNNLQFHRFYENKTNPGIFTQPLLPIDEADKDTEFLVTIDYSGLNSASKPFPVISYSSSSIQVGRYITVDNALEQTLESFLPGDFQSAVTYSDVNASLLGQSFIYIGVVVFTYGVDETLSQLYSLPLHLGQIRLSTFD